MNMRDYYILHKLKIRNSVFIVGCSVFLSRRLFFLNCDWTDLSFILVVPLDRCLVNSDCEVISPFICQVFCLSGESGLSHLYFATDVVHVYSSVALTKSLMFMTFVLYICNVKFSVNYLSLLVNRKSSSNLPIVGQNYFYVLFQRRYQSRTQLW